MTKTLMVRYLKFDAKKQAYKYRRRVPDDLKSSLGKAEFSKTLGKTEAEAMSNYVTFHSHVERTIEALKLSPGGNDAAKLKEDIEAFLYEMDADPYSPGKTASERLGREEAAERILRQYPVDPDSGWPNPDTLSQSDQAMVSALYGGVNAIRSELTIEGAYAFYLAENALADEFNRKKQVQRFGRSRQALLTITKGNLPLEKVQRLHARKLRDHYLGASAVSTARRNINDVKAVFSLAIREHDLNIQNPFARLDFPKPATAAIENRLSLPDDVIALMYGDLTNNQILSDIWTLMHHTGAQNAEILGLMKCDVHLDHDIPHIDITSNPVRGLKAISRKRRVPLVGLALDIGKRLQAETETQLLFPKYAETSKHTNFSQSIQKRLRKFTSDKRHTAYSLRHNMKDALIRANVGRRVELAILGHSLGTAAEAGYGSPVNLEDMYSALSRLTFSTEATV